MPVVIRAMTRLQDGDDVNVTLGSGVDNHLFVYDNSSGEFVLSEDIEANTITLANTTSSSTGIIQNADGALLHTFSHPTGSTAIPSGGNLFIGGAGNFTTGSTATNAFDASNNVGIGPFALAGLTTGRSNLAFGASSLRSNTTGIFNTAFGTNSLFGNTSGNSNLAFGLNALLSNTSGSVNTALGTATLNNNTTGSNNVAIGQNSGHYSQTGIGNLYIGYRCGGFGTGASFTGANYNTIIGYEAGYNLGSNDVNNVYIGYQAGYNETGSNKLYIANASGTPLIYGDFSTGRVGLGTTSPTAALDVKASTTSMSSIRIRSGTAPASPNEGDLWYDGTNLKFRDSTTTRTITWT